MPEHDQPPPYLVNQAIAEAARSPCAKSQRGAAIWLPALPEGQCRHGHEIEGPRLIATGHNSLVDADCDGSSACRSSCGKRCEHAEAAAIRWSRATAWPRPLEMLHVKVVDGALVPSGGPSCWQCSKAILADGRIGGMWLLHKSGWFRYDVRDLHDYTLTACGLPRLDVPVS